MNVKTATQGFPKAELKNKVVNRGDQYHMELAAPGLPPGIPKVFASVHKDIQPMVLVHTLGTSLPGPQRKRTWRGIVDGKRLKKVYTLD